MFGEACRAAMAARAVSSSRAGAARRRSARRAGRRADRTTGTHHGRRGRRGAARGRCARGVASSRRVARRGAARPVVLELEGLELDLLLDQLLDVGHQPRVVARDQRDGQARGAGAAGAADAVHVVLGVERHVEVEDRRQVGDVEAARRDVGGDQQVDLAALERVQRLQALVLRLVAMQRGGLQAVALEGARQPGGAELGVDEHQGLRQLRGAAGSGAPTARLSSSATL